MSRSFASEVDAKILDQHRERKALVYVRQSSPYQVEHHQESVRRQYALVDWARVNGWTAERIRVIDTDQGRSSSTPEAREGFSELITAVGRGEVGIVIASEISRLARNSPDWAHLIYLCRFTGTLVADEGGVYDPSRPDDRMILGIRGQVSELEVDTMVHRLVEARWNKARRGEFMTVPPVGYELDEQRRLTMTSDERVRSTLQTVFSKFEELGSANQVHVFFRENMLLFPVRRKELPGHPMVWVKPTNSRVLFVLHNPVYAGAYAFGRSQTVRKLDDNDPPKIVVRRERRADPPILIEDHHDGYISYEKFLENQERLRMNQTKKDENSNGPAREGASLLQGLVRCGVCGRSMNVSYEGRRPGRKGCTMYYSCSGPPKDTGKRICQVAFARNIEEEVCKIFLSVIEPAGIEALVLAQEKLQADEDEVARLLRLEVEKAEYEAQRAQRQYDAVDPENRVVARELERRWNAKLVELEEAKARIHATRAARRPLSEDELQKAEELAVDLPELWQAPTTDNRDRKRLLRCLIEEVQVRTEEDRYEIQVQWKGGALTNLVVRRQARGEHPRTSEETVELIRRLAVEFDDGQIALILNKQGRRSALDRRFTKEAVRCIRRKNDIPRPETPPPRDPREGPFTAEEAAAELQVSMSTVHRWLQDGVLAGRQITPGAPWRIPLTEEVRRRLSGGDAPEGWVGLTEAARRLGLSKSRVAYLVNTGKLKAVRATVRGRRCWRIDVSSATCGVQGDIFDQMRNGAAEET